MSIYEDFVDTVNKTDTMKSFYRNLEQEPIKLLGSICKEYEETQKAVPAHHLNLAGYFSEVLLRALVSAGLVTKDPEDRYSLYGYTPTETGLKYYKGMLNEKEI